MEVNYFFFKVKCHVELNLMDLKKRVQLQTPLYSTIQPRYLFYVSAFCYIHDFIDIMTISYGLAITEISN